MGKKIIINTKVDADSGEVLFAKGLCFQKLFFFFVIGCVFGCVWEETLEFLVQYSSTGTFHWVTRRGLIYFELSPVYGFGAAIIIYFLKRRDNI